MKNTILSIVIKVNFVWLIVFITASSVYSEDPLFDCSYGGRSFARLICEDERLEELDSLMSEKYYKLLKVSIEKEKKDIRYNQRKWLSSKMCECINVTGINSPEDKVFKECIKNKYIERINEINSTNVKRFATEYTTQIKLDMQIKYPPYPDIWGYELPNFDNNLYVGINVAKLKNEDYFITYIGSKQELERAGGACANNTKSIFKKLYFFSGKKGFISSREYNFLWGEQLDRIEWSFVKLSDGKKVDSGGECCGTCSMFTRTLILKGKNYKILKEKVPVILLDNPVKIPVSRPSEFNESLKSDYIFTRVVNIITKKFIPLKDDTFILFSKYSNIIIRLDKDFNSKSKLFNTKFFLIDVDVVKNIKERFKKSGNLNEQTLCDGVYEYIIKDKKI